MNSTPRERDKSHTTNERSTCSSLNLLHALSDDSEIDCLEENIVIDEITELEPTSMVLRYCKGKFLRPYVCILGLVGLRPNAVDVDLCTLLGHLQSIMVLTLLLAGYVLQYLSGFRRDRGFSTLDPPPAIGELSHQISTTNDDFPAPVTTPVPTSVGFATVSGSIMKTIMLNTSEMIFIYIIPALLHLGGFVIGIYIYRFADNEHLQCLIEKVFILCNVPRRLVVTLWVYFILGALWLAGSTAYVYLLTLKHSYVIASFPRWNSWDELDPTERDYVRIFLCVSLFFHDLVQVVIIISYSLMCYLLRCYLVGLKEKLLLHTIEPLNWMREICEFRKLLHHLNAKISLPVACLALLNLSYMFSSVVHLFQDMNSCPIRVFSYTVANVLLWLVISLMSFFQAASLTASCRQTQTCGHLISIRPFVHRNTSSEDLNTVLLYASSLNMSAKLFRMPINAHYLCFVVFVSILALLTFGMCLSLAIGGDVP
ncbi:uncharacterized protein LOC5565490 [Aedes aegypti]|uniref:Uncharacterized protein n=1 Tax=Aedes aegypti TaxID=7159 RepID=A0A6I8TA34_AEDAE|nr:uncharacterized protein LOC5565490 [Aedes aegypti]XP_021705969.1 uncharacterized protein LOC5565490 [Aedes aegypti]